jgi:hypothetical protein
VAVKEEVGMHIVRHTCGLDVRSVSIDVFDGWLREHVLRHFRRLGAKVQLGLFVERR